MGIQWDVQAKMYDTFQGHQTRLEDPWLYTGPSSCTRSKTQGTSLACTSQRGPANGCSQRYFQHAMFDPRRVLYPIFWACVEAGIRRFKYTGMPYPNTYGITLVITCGYPFIIPTLPHLHASWHNIISFLALVGLFIFVGR